MQHILLTGATGFLGSHLLVALLKEGYQLTILKRSTSDTWRIKHLLQRVTAFDVDLVPVEDCFKAKQVDAVIHTACNYGRNGQPAHEVAETNLLFGIQVLDAAVLCRAKLFINTDTFFHAGGSSHKYLNSYTLSKCQFVHWIQQQGSAITAVNLKIQHMYGPNDSPDKFVAWLIRQFAQEVARVPLTDGRQLRDFIYVDDVVAAYLAVLKSADNLPEYSSYDVGTGTLTRVKDFVELLYDTYQDRIGACVTQLEFGAIEMRHNRSLKELGWSVKISIQRGALLLCKHMGSGATETIRV